jgi:GGDEF domain-containing protein/CHASE3 domain sensor protein
MNTPEKKSIEAIMARWPVFRLTIAVKILIGYLGLAVVVVLISVMTLLSLKKLNDINSDIISVDAPIIELSDKLIDTILAQELYGRRYSLLRSPELLDLYKEKTGEFDSRMDELKSLPGGKFFSLDKLVSLHGEYSAAFQKMFEYKGPPASAQASELDKLLRERQSALTDFVKKISHDALRSQNKKSRLSAKTGDEAYRSIIGLGIIFIVVALITTILITRNIAGSIRKLKIATKKVAKGEFEDLPQVKSYDELGELSVYFSEMAKRLKQLEQILVDMSPLTRMPGNIAIENTLRKRLDGGELLAFCHFDLDNFKVFGDKYGYARGSEVIKATAQIIESAISEFGAKDDFMGHIGGDDFVVITAPNRYERICYAVIDAFDSSVPDFYSPEDRELGFIMGKTRQGTEMAFPLMSISIGVVTNRERELKDTLQVGEIAAELKECAKSRHGSNIVVDKVEEETL